jgi:hypothetical protein
VWLTLQSTEERARNPFLIETTMTIRELDPGAKERLQTARTTFARVALAAFSFRALDYGLRKQSGQI